MFRDLRPTTNDDLPLRDGPANDERIDGHDPFEPDGEAYGREKVPMTRWWIYGIALVALQIGLWRMILPQEPGGSPPSARDLLSDEARRGRSDETPSDPLELFRQRLEGMQRDDSLELRQRRIDPNEKMAASSLASFAPLVEKLDRSIVRLVDETGEMRAFGTVVRGDGLVVSKASELIDVPELFAETPSGKGSARVLAVNDRFDLALIHVAMEGLKPVEWADGEPMVGTLLVSPDEQGKPLAIGVVSVEARPLVERGRAYLGVEPVTVVGGVRIERVAPQSAAERAGLRVGDVVTKIGGRAVLTHHDFANTIRRHLPGDLVAFDLKRSDREISVEVQLDGVDAPAEFNGSPQEEMGASLSGRMSDFELVFQTDLPLWPEQCGSPVLDLDGKVVGLNIARSGRVRSYAIPSGKAKEVIDQMLATARVML